MTPLVPGLAASWKTLRFRLAAWNALVVVLTAAVILMGLRQGVRWTLLHELDQILIEDTSEIALALRDTRSRKFSLLTEDLNRKAQGHRHHGWFVKLIDVSGDVAWRSDGAPDDSPLLLRASTEPQTVNGHRVVRRAVRGDDRIAGMLVGARLELLEADLARIDRLVLIAAGAVLLAAPMIGYALARRAARTIGVIIDTAGRLRPAHLDERLPIHGTDDELDQLAHTVNGLLDRIAAYLRKRRDFLANAAHELRTPLAAIRSSVEVALGGKRSPGEYRALLEDIIEQALSLETLVNQLLLLSETESDAAAPADPVPLDQLVARAAEMFQGVAESKQISLHAAVDPDVHTLGRPQHLRQVVNNLIDNAVKYTQPGGRIDVRLSVDQPSHEAVLRISDNGPGIPPQDLPLVFDRFYRGDRSRARDDETAGNGLGLSICHAVVEAHHGTIACESTPGRGAAFTVRLPALPPKRSAASE